VSRQRIQQVVALLFVLTTTAQICTVDVVRFTADAAEICVTAGDEATAALNSLSGDTSDAG
jgi:hypothetical protein